MKAFVVAAVVGVALALPAAAAGPPSEVARLRHQVVLLRAKVKRLTAENARLRDANATLRDENATLDRVLGEVSARQYALQRHLLAVDPCPITRPNNSQPPGSTFGAVFHGNGKIWVGLPTTNIVSWQRDNDGAVRYKFGWWHETPGKLQIDGRRLDARAPPLRAEIPDGYGDVGFQATAIVFPTDGCWEVTGHVGGASLTFVTLVVGA